MTRFTLALFLFLLPVPIAFAQDPVKVDAKHYKVVFENANVRVLRIHYGPHEKSVMHEHPAGVAVYLTDLQGKFMFPDGKTEPLQGKSGETIWTEAGKHLPENTSDRSFELILVELKGNAARGR